MTDYTSKEIGNYGEDCAVSYLRRHGYWIKERNYRSGHYEIDIIACNFHTVIFVEVKARSYTKEEVGLLPPPGTAVKSKKQQYTRSAARQYLYETHCKKSPRMDVIEVWLEKRADGKKPSVLKIHHIPGAY